MKSIGIRLQPQKVVVILGEAQRVVKVFSAVSGGSHLFCSREERIEKVCRAPGDVTPPPDAIVIAILSSAQIGKSQTHLRKDHLWTK
jgi:hypothetical protein